jgi:hypothetical protein
MIIEEKKKKKKKKMEHCNNIQSKKCSRDIDVLFETRKVRLDTKSQKVGRLAHLVCVCVCTCVCVTLYVYVFVCGISVSIHDHMHDEIIL